jgi:hypothetical protein
MALSVLYGVYEENIHKAVYNLTTDSLKMALVTNAYAPNKDTHAAYADITNEVVGAGYTAGGAALAGLSLVRTAANSWGTSRAASTAYTVGQIVKPASSNGFVYRCVVAGTTGADVAPTAGTNASPIVVTATGHGLTTGNAITIAGVTGNTNMNAASLALVLTANTYNLVNPATLALINGNGAFGGTATIVPTWPTVVGQQFTDGGVTWVCCGTFVVKFTCTAPTWPTATITARGGVVYSVTAANKLVCYNDFGADITSTAATFTATPDANNGLFCKTD